MTTSWSGFESDTSRMHGRRISLEPTCSMYQFSVPLNRMLFMQTLRKLHNLLSTTFLSMFAGSRQDSRIQRGRRRKHDLKRYLRICCICELHLWVFTSILSALYGTLYSPVSIVRATYVEILLCSHLILRGFEYKIQGCGQFTFQETVQVFHSLLTYKLNAGMEK
jgi:hypothetical protein